MEYTLEVAGLAKSFGRREIFRDLSFQVPRGASLAITGPSGCGKSTLLNIIGMLESPDAGHILVDGKRLPGINSAAATLLRRRHINYLFQSYALVSDKSALDNVLLGLRYAPGSKSQKVRDATELLTRLGLGEVVGEKVNTLSGGEQQRVALARCILKPGDLILADEPTGALDAHLAERVFEELLVLQREAGKTLVLVTHDAKLAARCEYHLQMG